MSGERKQSLITKKEKIGLVVGITSVVAEFAGIPPYPEAVQKDLEPALGVLGILTIGVIVQGIRERIVHDARSIEPSKKLIDVD